MNRVKWVRAFLAAAAAGLIIYLLAAPKPWAIDDEVKIWGWGGGAVALAGVLLLLATVKWWMVPSPSDAIPTKHSPAPRWFWPLVAIAMGIIAVTSSMRLNHDLWADEEYTLRLFVQGTYKPDPASGDGAVIFKEFGAGRAFHHYSKPTNHVFFSILSRLSVTVWKWFRQPGGQPFSEAALRFPAWVFGMLAIAAVALLGKELGFPRAGVMAAFLMAFHPWILRYASEARGYSMILCFVPLLAVCWMRAVRTNRWHWWASVGALQFAIVYTNPSIIYPVAVLAALTPVAAFLCIPRQDRTAALLRWMAASFAGALLFILLFAPCMPQLRDYLTGTTQAHGEMGVRWVKELGAYLLSGQTWSQSQNPADPYPTLIIYSMRSPWIFAGIIGFVVVAGAAGLVRVARQSKLHVAVVAYLILPAFVAFAAAEARGWYLYEWYLIYALVGAAIFIAAGIDVTGRNTTRGWVIPALVTTAFLTAHLDMTRGIRTWFLAKPLEPMRESILLTRPTTLPNYPGHNDVITASFSQPPYLYDPHFVRVKTPDELITLMKLSDEQGRPLYLNVGGIPAAQTLEPEMTRLMLSSPQFEIVARLPGWEPYWGRVVARYVPGSVSKLP